MLVRNSLLFLSRQKQLRQWVESSPTAQRWTRRFVAGKTLEEGLAVCARLNAENITATLDHLGESVSSIEEGAATRDAYLVALRQISDLHLKATVSIKLTHFGLDFSEELCLEYVDAVFAEARDLGISVEVDMESLDYVDRTLGAVNAMHDRYGNVRAVIQAYLRRSEDDIRALCQKGIPVRLCKGAYKEPDSVAFPSKPEVDQNYLRLVRILLSDGVRPAVATHDERIVEEVVRIVRSNGQPAADLEFQMLFGIRKSLQRRLVREGFRMRLYVPYGVAWYPYFMRRLAENPRNLRFLVRNLLRR